MDTVLYYWRQRTIKSHYRFESTAFTYPKSTAFTYPNCTRFCDIITWLLVLSRAFWLRLSRDLRFYHVVSDSITWSQTFLTDFITWPQILVNTWLSNMWFYHVIWDNHFIIFTQFIILKMSEKRLKNVWISHGPHVMLHVIRHVIFLENVWTKMSEKCLGIIRSVRRHIAWAEWLHCVRVATSDGPEFA